MISAPHSGGIQSGRTVAYMFSCTFADAEGGKEEGITH